MFRKSISKLLRSKLIKEKHFASNYLSSRFYQINSFSLSNDNHQILSEDNSRKYQLLPNTTLIASTSKELFKEIENDYILKVICKISYNNILKEGICFGIHLPKENEFDKVIVNKKTEQKEEKCYVLSIIYGLQQALHVSKIYPNKYKQVTLYTGIEFFSNTESRNKYLLKFNDSYKLDIDNLIDQLKPTVVTFEHHKLLEKSLNKQAPMISPEKSVVQNNSIQKTNKTVENGERLTR